ncbi:MAG: glycosyltransferase, partial [Gemmatimonadales bacterium]|nr:glycosyltransferase [Gemmatimonadales bacterium]
MAGPSLLWVNHFAVTPADGGGTRHYDLARTLARLGWTVTVASADFHLHGRRYTRRAGASDRRAIHEPLDGVRFAWLWSAPYAGNDWRRVRNWLSFARRVATADWSAPRPDVVIGSSPHLFAALGAWWAARRLEVPFVLEVRDLWPESLEAVSGRRGALYHTLDRLATFLYARADRIVVLARGSA